MASKHQGTPLRGHSTRGFVSQPPLPDEPGQRFRTAEPVAGRSVRCRKS